MTQIAALLDQVVESLTKRGSQITDYLQPGLIAGAIHGLFDPLPFEPAPEVVALFSWRNGIDYRQVPSGVGLFEHPLFWPLEHAIEQEWRFHRSIAEEDGFGLSPWGQADWFPVLAFEGETMSVVCTGEKQGSVYYCFSQADPELIFTDLHEALETAIYCIEAEIWRLEGYQLRSDRMYMPSSLDRSHPPS